MQGMTYIKNVVTLQYDAEKCIGCDMCTIVCPHAVFERMNGKVAIRDMNACMECGACERNCPTNAITVRSGVGCAAGILSGMISGGEPCCGPSDDDCSSACC